jgi:serine/threonine protein kinase
MLTGYHPFKEDSYLGILFRIFKTLGTPTMTDFLEYPTITSEQACPQFNQNYDKFPRWSGMSIESMLPAEVGVEATDLLKQLLQVEPSKRISAEKALHHAFFSEINPTQ